MSFLRDLIPLGNVRRIHGLEHATIHVLSERYPYTSISGRSTAGGFFVYGNIPTEDVAAGAREALQRVQAGQHHLAIHPHCGTNLVVAGVLAGLTSLVVNSIRSRSLVDRVARVTLSSTAAVLFAQPLGPIIQERITTSPNLNDLEIEDVSCHRLGKIVVHKIVVGSRRPVIDQASS
jgi:hypothetical protein